jgi:hypothetical protein
MIKGERNKLGTKKKSIAEKVSNYLYKRESMPLEKTSGRLNFDNSRLEIKNRQSYSTSYYDILKDISE